MSVTSGFFNSKNGDRKYNAEQMSSIFDGIIRDGIFQHIGTSMMVTAGSGMEVIVGIGRAWFKHTWTLNDSLLPVAIDPAEVLFKRIDAVILEVDNRETVRQNSIKVVKGTPGNSPERPTLIKENDRAQYALAYVEVGAAVASITQANITNMVGTGDTPFITAPLEKMNIDSLVAQWQSQYTQWRDGLNTNAQNWRTEFEQLMSTWKTGITQDYDSWTTAKRQAFDDWFNNIKATLSGDVAANLANRITALENKPTEDAVINKNKQVTAQDVNNANYPFPYVAAINFGKQVGLPTDWAYIQYFRHQNNDGYGSQIAIKLDRGDQESDNSKLWTMKIRIASGMAWGAWENVATSIPKGHYAVSDLNLCQEDGNHYYFNSATANKPPLHGDGIVSVYAYNAGTNDNQSVNPHIVQVSHSWHQDSIFMRSGRNGVFTNWREVGTYGEKLFVQRGASENYNNSEPAYGVSIGQPNLGLSWYWNNCFGMFSNGREIAHVDPNGFHINNERILTSWRLGGAWFGDDDPRNGELILDTNKAKFKLDDGRYITPNELFTSASNGKTLLANTLTGMGTPTSTTASWQTIADNMKLYKYKVGHIMSPSKVAFKGHADSTRLSVYFGEPLIEGGLCEINDTLFMFLLNDGGIRVRSTKVSRIADGSSTSVSSINIVSDNIMSGRPIDLSRCKIKMGVWENAGLATIVFASTSARNTKDSAIAVYNFNTNSIVMYADNLRFIASDDISIFASHQYVCANVDSGSCVRYGLHNNALSTIVVNKRARILGPHHILTISAWYPTKCDIYTWENQSNIHLTVSFSDTVNGSIGYVDNFGAFFIGGYRAWNDSDSIKYNFVKWINPYSKLSSDHYATGSGAHSSVWFKGFPNAAIVKVRSNISDSSSPFRYLLWIPTIMRLGEGFFSDNIDTYDNNVVDIIKPAIEGNSIIYAPTNPTNKGLIYKYSPGSRDVQLLQLRKYCELLP